jgi:hypothetical protein
MSIQRKKTVKTKCERFPETDEYYLLTFTTHDQVLEAKVDKENLRHMIEIIDNEII